MEPVRHCNVGAVQEPDSKLVVVFESEGGSLPALLAFMECVLGDEPTRALIESADVKIYQAFSAAALLAFWMGGRREMAAGTRIGFHLPMLILKSWQVDREGRRIDDEVVRQCQRYETFLAELMRKLGLDAPQFNDELYGSGWLYFTAEAALDRGLIDGIF